MIQNYIYRCKAGKGCGSISDALIVLRIETCHSKERIVLAVLLQQAMVKESGKPDYLFPFTSTADFGV